MRLVNPRGQIIGVSDKKVEWLLSQGFRKVDDTNITQPVTNKAAKKIRLLTSIDKPDGYGQSQKSLVNALELRGIQVDHKDADQEIGLCYFTPVYAGGLKTPIKIIYTMFESSTIPEEWVPHLKRADKVLVPSKFCQKAFATRGIDTTVVPLGYNNNVYSHLNRPRHDVFTFLHYNAFNIRKGFDLVFKAFTEEFRTDEPVRLVLKTVTARTPFPILKSEYPNIDVLRGEYSDGQMIELLRDADAFVFPSRGEGFGLTPLEALATGLPVIIPNSSGMSEYFDENYFYKIDVKGNCPAVYANYKNVGTMEEPDLDSLKKQMRYVYEHQKEAKDKARAGAEWVAQNWTIEKTADKLIDVFNNIHDEIAKKEVADINLVTLLWSSNGMGRVGEEVLLSLDRLGVKVKILPDFLEKEGLQKRTLELLELSENYTRADKTLFYAVPTILPRDCATKNYLHIDWDTTKAPKIWVEKINKYITKVYPSTQFVKDVFTASGVTEPQEVITHGVRADRFPYFNRSDKGQCVFLTCGDISQRKGTDILISAFLKAFPSQKDVKLVIKSNHNLEWGQIEAPNDPRIEVINKRMEHEEFLELYKQASCYVAPSRAEGFCLPALEAMSTGLPTIIHNWSGMASLANAEYNLPIGSSSPMGAGSWHYPEEYQTGDGIGDWCNPNEAELIEKMKYVYANRKEANELGKKASEWVRDKWDWDKQVQKMWIDIMEQDIPTEPRSAKINEWGKFYEKAHITKDHMTLSANAHKELFWVLGGFYPKKVIESGCGPATMSAFISKGDMEIEGTVINKSKIEQVIALDNDSGVLEVAKQNIKELGGSNVTLLNADAFTSTEQADVVFAQGMLEHWSNEKMRELVANQLRQAPVVIHSVPNNSYKRQDFGNERLLTDEQYYKVFEDFDVTVYRYWLEDGVKKMTLLVFKRPEDSTPKVSIIMPVFNNLEVTRTAIEAVRQNTKDYELIVLDNHSTDGTAKWLDEQSDLRVIHLSRNLGVPAAKNLGIALARGEYVCFLDNDTVAHAGWLDTLLEPFSDPTVGFVGADGYLIDKEKHSFLGNQFSFGQEVEWCGHSIFVFPRKLIRETGLLLDRDLWCIEDVDHCCAIRNLGYRGMTPYTKANIEHLGGFTALKMPEMLAKFQSNCNRIWNKWGDFINNRGLGAKIDIGSGDNPMLGFIHVDIQKISHVDIIAEADKLPIPDSVVSEIYSSHLAEHFTRQQFDVVLSEWRRVLKDGGTLIIKCPDILTVASKLLNKEVDYNLGVSWIYGGQRTQWDYHYWGYSFDSLREKLERIGFGEITRLHDVDDWLKVRATCIKEENSQDKEPLHILFKSNHHHILGGGENMSCSVAKILSELYTDFELDTDLTTVNPKTGFNIDLDGVRRKTGSKPDVFVCISHWSLPVPGGKKNVLIVFYPQFDWSRDIAKYDKLVAISKFSANAIKEKWGLDSVVIPPSIDTTAFHCAEKKNQIISVGRFFWQAGGNMKNQHVLIEAFSQMPKGWKLVLVGSVQNESYYQTLKKMAKGLDVEFVHDIPFEKLTELYAESKLFWSATGYGTEIASSQEHFGIVGLEALASGCRTLVFDGGGMAEINGVEIWSTTNELIQLSCGEGKKSPQELIDGVREYSNEVAKEKWRTLIDNL